MRKFVLFHSIQNPSRSIHLSKWHILYNNEPLHFILFVSKVVRSRSTIHVVDLHKYRYTGQRLPSSCNRNLSAHRAVHPVFHPEYHCSIIGHQRCLWKVGCTICGRPDSWPTFGKRCRYSWKTTSQSKTQNRMNILANGFRGILVE